MVLRDRERTINGRKESCCGLTFFFTANLFYRVYQITHHYQEWSLMLTFEEAIERFSCKIKKNLCEKDNPEEASGSSFPIESSKRAALRVVWIQR